MKRTQHEILVMFLGDRRDWVPAHELSKLLTPYGYVGSAGDVRARELARNECSDKLKGKVERAEGREIGLDPRFAYYRFKQAAPTQLALV
jgi:hypothetical protein